MPTNVLAQLDQSTRGRKQPGRMDSTRAVELALLGTQQLGQLEQRFERHYRPLGQRSAGDLDHVD